MLAHSPPLPLVVDYGDKFGDVTAEDEEGTILALKQRGRVLRVRLLYTDREAKLYVLAVNVLCWHLEYLPWHRFSDSLGQMFFALEHLALVHEVRSRSYEEHNEVDRTGPGGTNFLGRLGT